MSRATTSAPGVDSRLASQLTSAIIAMIAEHDLPEGHRLTERTLADALRVSRTPVRRALQQLHADGFVGRTDTGRYYVARSGESLDAQVRQVESDEVYLRIAADRLDGRLPDKVSEAFLSREYRLTRVQVTQLLMRISNEGWAVQRPGKGWEFLPVLTSLESYGASYRFRLLVEPEAILEPTFELDGDAIARRRAEQQQLVDGRIHDVSAPELFELNSAFHEAIAVCSRNEFFVESLARINRLRRLIEYRQTLNPERAVVRCAEHVHLADLLLGGDRTGASAFLRQHLTTVGDEKTHPTTRL